MACNPKLTHSNETPGAQNCYYLQILGATPNIHNAADTVQLPADLAVVCAWGRCRVASPGLLPQAWEAPLHDVRRRDGDAPLRRTFRDRTNEMPPVSEGGNSDSPSDTCLRSSPCVALCRGGFTPRTAPSDRGLGSYCARRCAA